MNIRPARVDDAPGIAAIHVASWRAAYQGLLPQALLDELSVESRTALWQRLLARSARATFVCEKDGQLQGFIDVAAARDEDLESAVYAEINAVYLLPDIWGGGHGRRLVERACSVLRQQNYEHVVLWVLDSNERAIAFYRALGFAADGASKVEKGPHEAEFNEIRLRKRLD